MIVRSTIAAMTAAATLFVLPGCAIQRGQSTVGEYIDDATITTQVKAKMVENKQVDAAAISVETLNGTVMLSGFAKTSSERQAAEAIARDVKGVRSVRNEIAVRG
jgi:hyperosmotically inducible protein